MQSENGCPFCRQHVIHIVESQLPTAIEGLQVQCDNCGARGPIYENEEEALTGWEFGISDLGKRLRVS